MYRRHQLRAAPSISHSVCSRPLQHISMPPSSCRIIPSPSAARSFHASNHVSLRHRAPWEVLGVPPNADEITVKRAWREKAKEYHPDLNKADKKANDRFVEAKQAMLSPEKKMQWEMEQRTEAQYNRRNAKRSTPNQPPPDAGEDEMRQFWRDFEKIFQDMDKVKRGKTYQRVKVEFKRPFRGSDFAWTYEEEEAPQERQKNNNKKNRRNNKNEGPKTMNDFFSTVFESFFSDSMPRAEWKELNFLPSRFMVQESKGGEEFQVLGDAISFGTVRTHPQDSKLFEYSVNGKIVARGALSAQEIDKVPHEVLTIYNARGTLIGTVTGPQTSKWFHAAKTYNVVDAFGRQLSSIDHSLVLFNRMVWFDEHTHIVGGASRSRVAARAPFQFTFAYQPDDIHPAFFVLPLVAFRSDKFASGKGIFNTLKDDFSKIMDWASGKR